MDNKRLILAIALSIVIVGGWNYLAIHMGWIIPKENIPAPATTQTPAMESIPVPTAMQQPPVVIPTAETTILVETPLYKAVFLNNGAVLKEFTLKKYSQERNKPEPVSLISKEAAKTHPMALTLAGVNTATTGAWAIEGSDLYLQNGEVSSIRFTGSVEGMHVIREYTFNADNYTINEKLRVLSPITRDLKVGFSMAASSLSYEKTVSALSNLKHLILGGEAPVPTESQYNITKAAWVTNDSFSDESDLGDLEKKEKHIVGATSWTGIMNNYFLCAVSMPADANNNMFVTAKNGVVQTILGKVDLKATAGVPLELESAYYLGPKEAKMLEQAPYEIAKALHYGFFTIIAKPLVALLKFFYSYVHNYGTAIVLMTILIKIIFWPLSQKSYKSMEQMKKLQPEIAKLREKYADDKETLNKETMQLYKAYKVNPAGGCLPILVQIPVFFGLYQALLNAIELRHAPFIEYLPFTDNMPWLADLSAADPTCITPLVMGASMFLQQKMAPAPADPTQAKIMLFMPLVFTVVFLGFPSGLVIYWLVNNIISIGQQWWMRRGNAA